MKNQFLLLLFSLFSSALMGQPGGRIGDHDAIAKWTPSTSINLPFTTAAEGRQIAQQIIDVVGLRANFDVREANIPNAAAVVYSGKRYILYNPAFISQLTNISVCVGVAASSIRSRIIEMQVACRFPC